MDWRNVVGVVSIIALPILLVVKLVVQPPDRLPPIVRVGLVVAVGFVVFAILGLVVERLGRRRNRRLSVALGWRYPVADGGHVARSDLPCLRSATSLRVSDLAVVEASATRAWTADLEAVYPWAFERQPHPARFTAAAVELPLAAVPTTLILGPVPIFDGDWAFDGLPNEPLEQVAFPPPFGARWRVWTRDPAFARRLITREAQAWFRRAAEEGASHPAGLPGCEFELEGAWLLGRVPPTPFAERPALLEATRSFRAHLGL